jgi:hypothetical protein
MWPWGPAGAAPAGFRPGPVGEGPVGKGPGRSTRSPGSRWAPGFGRREGRRGSSVAMAGASRGGGKFRQGRGEFGQRATGEASTWSQGGVG